MKGFETILVTKDEDGNDVTPYNFTRVCENSWQRGGKVSKAGRRYGHTLVSNDLPEGFAEAVDLDND